MIRGIALIILIIFLILFMMYGPPDIYTRTSVPEFCNMCHPMETQFEAWYRSGVHRSVGCVECHLPNNNHPNHILWKGIDGMKDILFFHGNLYSEPLRLSSHGEKHVQGNCIRCHQGMISRINTEGRNCWDCHRRIKHKYPETNIFLGGDRRQ